MARGQRWPPSVTMPSSCPWQIQSMIIGLFCCISITSESFPTQYAAIIRVGAQMKSLCHLCCRTTLGCYLLPPQIRTAPCSLRCLCWDFASYVCFASRVIVRLDGSCKSGGIRRDFIFPYYFLWLSAFFP